MQVHTIDVAAATGRRMCMGLNVKLRIVGGTHTFQRAWHRGARSTQQQQQ